MNRQRCEHDWQQRYANAVGHYRVCTKCGDTTWPTDEPERICPECGTPVAEVCVHILRLLDAIHASGTATPTEGASSDAS